MNPQMVVKIAASLADFKAALADGRDQIVTTTAAMQKIATSFSGDKLIQQAHNVTAAVHQIGGAAKLTETEQARVNATLSKAIEKYQAMGKEAPSAMIALHKETTSATTSSDKLFAGLSKVNGVLGLFGAGISIGAVVGFGQALLDDADALTKLHAKTDISYQGLQRFQIAADDAGNTLDQLTSAVTQMQNRLASGDASALSALQRLGIHFEDIKNLNPENQFYAIAAAIADVKDPAVQVQLAMDLFGKSGAEILPTLKRGFDDLRDAAVGMSDETIEALDTVGDTMTSLWRTTKGFAAETIVDLARFVRAGMNPTVYAAQQGAREIDDMRQQMERMLNAAKPAAKAMAEPWQLSTISIEGAIRAQDRLDAEQKKHLETVARLRAEQDKIIEAQKRWTDSVEASTVAMRLSVFTLNRFGAVELPAVTSSLEGADRVIHELASEALPNLHINLNKVGRAGIDSASAIEDAAKQERAALESVSQAFTQLSQIAGGGMGQGLRQMGEMVAAINLARQSMDALSKSTGDWQKMLAGALGFAGAVMSIGTSLQRALDPFFSGLDGDKLERMIRLVQQMQEEEQRLIDLAEEASRRFGPSQEDLDAAAARATELYEFVRDSGKYTEEQVHAAWRSMMEAMAAAGDEAAKAWLKAQAAAEQGATDVERALADLQKQRDGLAQSIANEAPEEVMGVIESQILGQIAVLDKQMEAQRAALEQQADDAIDAFDRAVARYAPDVVRVPVQWDVPPFPVPGNNYEAPEDVRGNNERDQEFGFGGDFVASKRMRIVVGEAGPERVTITPAGQMGNGDVVSELRALRNEMAAQRRQQTDDLYFAVRDGLAQRVR